MKNKEVEPLLIGIKKIESLKLGGIELKAILKNKKALIVESMVEFSHILALSKALRIPSIYGTGPVDLSKYQNVSFSAITKHGYVLE